MADKQLTFEEAAQVSLLSGVDQLRRVVGLTLGPQRAQRDAEPDVRQSGGMQRRRHHRQGSGTARPLRKSGGATGERGGVQNQ